MDKERIKRGNCYRCNKPRGKEGTTLLCRLCADKHTERQKQRQRELAKKGKCSNCGKQKNTLSKYHCFSCLERVRKRVRKRIGCKKWNKKKRIGRPPLEETTKEK